MRERGKASDDYIEGDVLADFSYYSSTEMQCKWHPSFSTVGICAQCLKDRLVKLVCSECGEQRLSSCSCSDFSSYPDSTFTGDVGSVGRISFLIENEKPRKDERENDVILLRRSTSSCVEVKKHKGFWKIKRLFKKKIENKGCEKDGGFDDKSEVWVSDVIGVSRSRSLCSFRGGNYGLNDTDEGSDYRFSSAKISDVTGSVFFDHEKRCGLEPRKSGFRGVYDEIEPRKSGVRALFDGSEPRNSAVSAASNETEPRKSGFRGVLDAEKEIDFKNAKKGCLIGLLERTNSVPNMSVFSIKESEFNAALDESAFIDLKLDPSLDTKPVIPLPTMRTSGGLGLGSETKSLWNLKQNGVRVSENVLKGAGSRRYNKVWKWLSRHHSVSKSARKKDEDNRTI